MDLQWRIALNLIFAFVVGGLVGLNRELSNRPAGVRTQILICVGSALLTSISIHSGAWLGVNTDPMRLTAQIVSGIGFIGGGVILKSSERVIGVTTAAMIWYAAALGIGIGTEFYLPVVIGTFLLLLTEPIAYLEYRLGLKNKPYLLSVKKKDYHHAERILKEVGLEEDFHTLEADQIHIALYSGSPKNLRLEKAFDRDNVWFELRRRERFVT